VSLLNIQYFRLHFSFLLSKKFCNSLKIEKYPSHCKSFCRFLFKGGISNNPQGFTLPVSQLSIFYQSQVPNRNRFIVDIVVIAIDLKTRSRLNGYLFLGPAQNIIRCSACGKRFIVSKCLTSTKHKGKSHGFTLE
jgi:hypothetical protein